MSRGELAGQPVPPEVLALDARDYRTRGAQRQELERYGIWEPEQLPEIVAEVWDADGDAWHLRPNGHWRLSPNASDGHPGETLEVLLESFGPLFVEEQAAKIWSARFGREDC